MPVNSRRKGSQAERDVVKMLKEHFRGTFERKSLGIPGPDILCPPHWIYAIEVKNDKALKAIHLLGKPSMLLQAYWQQADSQADALDKSPLLVAKVESLWLCTDDGQKWVPFERWCEREKDAVWNLRAEIVNDKN